MRSRSACAGSFVSVSTRAQRLRERGQRLHRAASRRAGRRSSCRPRCRRRGSSRGCSPAPSDQKISSWACEPTRPASAKPSPIPTPFIAWIDMIACASRPSRRSSQEMCEPMPGHEPERAHLEHAAERLVRLPGGVDLGDHRLARVGVEAAHRRLVDALEVAHGAGRRARGAVDRADPRDVRAHLHPERAQERLRERRPRPPGRPSRARDARSSTLRTSVWPNFWMPARSAWPGRGRWTSSTSASTGHGFIRSSQFW